MKYLKRGSLCFGLLALIMTMFYFQPTVEAAFRKAINSQNDKEITIEKSITQNIKTENVLNNNLENNLQENVLNNNLETQNIETNLENNLENKTEGLSENNSEAVVSEGKSYRATAYCLRGKTASGRMVRRGIVAADPRVLPLGTRVRLSAGKYSGTYIVADTGGKIKGRILDIWVPSCAEARRWGRRTVKVTVLSKGKSRSSKKRRKRKG